MNFHMINWQIIIVRRSGSCCMSQSCSNVHIGGRKNKRRMCVPKNYLTVAGAEEATFQKIFPNSSYHHQPLFCRSLSRMESSLVVRSSSIIIRNDHSSSGSLDSLMFMYELLFSWKFPTLFLFARFSIIFFSVGSLCTSLHEILHFPHKFTRPSVSYFRPLTSFIIIHPTQKKQL